MSKRYVREFGLLIAVFFVICTNDSISQAQSITTPTANTSYASSATISVLGTTGQADDPYVIEVRFPNATGNVLGTISGMSNSDKSFAASVIAPSGGWTGPGGGAAGVIVLYCKDANGNDTTVTRNVSFF